MPFGHDNETDESKRCIGREASIIVSNMRRGLLPLLLAASVLSAADLNPTDTGKVVDEGKNHNNLYSQLKYLTKHIGPGVTGSPQLMAADEWAMRAMRNYGFSNVHLEEWDVVPVGFWRGPNSKARMIAPVEMPLVFSTNNWTAGTRGAVKGPALLQPKSVEAVRALGTKLKSAWILMPTKVGMSGPRLGAPTDLDRALDAAGIAGRIYGTTRPDLVWSHGRYTGIDPKNLPDRVLISLQGKDFDAISGYLDAGKPVTLEFNVDNRFTGKPQPVYNVVGEVPGTDKKDEVVVIGGHFDSWNSPGSEGAADNGTGAMIALEAARIIKATGVAHRRTLRVILYSGEEEGLLGSRGYVKTHRADLDSIVGVLNDDEGTNAETGFTMLHGAESMLAPLPPLVNDAFPKMPIAIRYGDRMPGGGGSDHASFVAAGVPAISWGKADKPVSYGFIWHTQNDNLENVYPEGLIQSSTCSALTLYLLLNVDAKLPRPPKSSESAN